MTDDKSSYENKLNALEKARDQLSRDWLAEEREKTRLSAAVDGLSLGFMIVDDYQMLVRKNPAVDMILGKSDVGDWSVIEIQNKIGDVYNFQADVIRSYREKIQIGPRDVQFGSKKLRFFMSPIVVLKESLTASGTVILIEEIKATKA